MSDILKKIIASKHEELKAAKRLCSATLMQQCAYAFAQERQKTLNTRDFYGMMAHGVAARRSTVIAEIKRASPSKGFLRSGDNGVHTGTQAFDVAYFAKTYAHHGATCLSILSDTSYFYGHEDYIALARRACSLPILRKDFMVDTYHIWQSCVIGADAVLLIMAAFDATQQNLLHDMASEAHRLNMAVIAEVHDEDELERALLLDHALIGINNRNLRTFHTDLSLSIRLAKQIPPNRVVIAESGIAIRDDITHLQDSGIYAYLVGESLMRQDDPGVALHNLIGAFDTV